MNDEHAAIERVKKLKAEYLKSIQKEVDAVKEEFSNRMGEAVELYVVLKDLEANDVYGEPPFVTLIDMLELKSSPRAARSSKSKRNSLTTANAILQVLKGGAEMDIASIMAGVVNIKGNVSKVSVSGALGKLTKEKEIKNPSRGKYRLA